MKQQVGITIFCLIAVITVTATSAIPTHNRAEFAAFLQRLSDEIWSEDEMQGEMQDEMEYNSVALEQGYQG